MATVTSYISRKITSDHEPQKLVSPHLATMEPAGKFGRLAPLEAERRGIRSADQVIVMGEGAGWIDGIADRHFPAAIRIVDWYHAVEYLHAAAKAVHPNNAPDASALSTDWKNKLCEGPVDPLILRLREQAEQLGTPSDDASANDPRKSSARQPATLRITASKCIILAIKTRAGQSARE